MKLKIFMTILAVVFTSQLTYAQQMQGIATQSDLELANKSLVLTKPFGDFETAFVSKSPNGQMLIEYLPKGDKLENWTTMASLTIIPCTLDMQICGKMSQQIGDKIINMDPSPYFKKVMIDHAIWKSDNNTTPETSIQTTYFYYTIGEGAIKETNAGFIFFTTGSNNIFQIQKRQKDSFQDQEIKKIRINAEMIANAQNKNGKDN